MLLLESELKTALIKDFDTLYTREFTYDWEVQRMLRMAEIMVMDFSHLIKLIEQHNIQVDIDCQH